MIVFVPNPGCVEEWPNADAALVVGCPTADVPDLNAPVQLDDAPKPVAGLRGPKTLVELLTNVPVNRRK